MRTGRVAGWLLVAIAAAGCSAPLGTAREAGSGGNGGTSGSAAFCSTALGANCSASPLQIAATVCTLDMGIAAACGPCGPQDGGEGCTLTGALVRGATHDYVQIRNIDVAYVNVYVYDQNQKLVAKLFWSVNARASGGSGWSCSAGPADFDPTEAISLLPVLGQGELSGMCAG
jgi:hypothetical protein